MEIDDKGLPIHKDATLKIRPRIFLEGNFFVDLHAGHAVGADDRRRRHDPDHARPPTPVQLDQVLTALQSDTRDGPAGALDGLGDGADLQADAPPTTSAPTPSARGESARRVAQRRDPLRRAPRCSGTAIVTDALPGHRARTTSRGSSPG